MALLTLFPCLAWWEKIVSALRTTGQNNNVKRKTNTFHVFVFFNRMLTSLPRPIWEINQKGIRAKSRDLLPRPNGKLNDRAERFNLRGEPIPAAASRWRSLLNAFHCIEVTSPTVTVDSARRPIVQLLDPSLVDLISFFFPANWWLGGA